MKLLVEIAKELQTRLLLLDNTLLVVKLTQSYNIPASSIMQT